MKKRKRADTFDVWGKPPQALTNKLTAAQMIALRRYTEIVVGKCYRLAFDNGVSHAFSLVSETVMREWKAQRLRVMRRKDHP